MVAGSSPVALASELVRTYVNGRPLPVLRPAGKRPQKAQQIAPALDAVRWSCKIPTRAANTNTGADSKPARKLPMFTFLLWCLLFVLCWPLALAVLVLYPIVWLVLLPFRLLGLTFEVVFETLEALLTLPARVVRRLA